jgi:hypothetical protein
MKAAAEAGNRASRADSRTPPNLVLGASLLLPFARMGGFSVAATRWSSVPSVRGAAGSSSCGQPGGQRWLGPSP